MEKKYAKPRLIRWVLTATRVCCINQRQEGSNNVIADHLFRLEKTTKEEKGSDMAENFLDEQLFFLSVQVPWYVDIVNYLVCEIMPPEFSYQHKRKLRTDSIFYI